MPSSVEAALIASDCSLSRWITRLHYYLGLYFIFFIWLFAVTGLLLNHGMWGMADVQRSRTIAKSEHRISLANTEIPLSDAHDVMQQLQIHGEVQWLGTPSSADRLDFRVARPGVQPEVRVDLTAATAVVERATVNTLGAACALHLFTGVRMNDRRNDRDWLITTLWALSLDSVAARLLVMVGSGIWIWLQTRKNRIAGVMALSLGVLCCAWFLVGVAAFQN